METLIGKEMKRKSDQEKEGRKEEKKMPTIFSCSWLFIHAMSTEAKRFLGSWV
ncbi:hypothetical protein Peur_062247 [Populus x canadensis]|jgi:hypothetical protein